MNIKSLPIKVNSNDPGPIDCAPRREFLKQLGMTVAGLALSGGAISALLESCGQTTEPVAVTHGTTAISVATLTKDGSYLVDNTVHPDGTPILVVRQSAGNFTALSMRCTHEGSQVNAPANGQIYCASHGSVFSLTGAVIQGPAGSPLTKYTTAFDATSQNLTITY